MGFLLPAAGAAAAGTAAATAGATAASTAATLAASTLPGLGGLAGTAATSALAPSLGAAAASAAHSTFLAGLGTTAAKVAVSGLVGGAVSKALAPKPPSMPQAMKAPSFVSTLGQPTSAGMPTKGSALGGTFGGLSGAVRTSGKSLLGQ